MISGQQISVVVKIDSVSTPSLLTSFADAHALSLHKRTEQAEEDRKTEWMGSISPGEKWPRQNLHPVAE
jgi:hypothetical protein